MTSLQVFFTQSLERFRALPDLAKGGVALGVALFVLLLAAKLGRKGTGRRKATDFARLAGFESKGRDGGSEIFRKVSDGHTVEVRVGDAVEISVVANCAAPEGLEISLGKTAPRARVKLWVAQRRMDPAFFDEYVQTQAKHAVALKDFLTERRKEGLLRCFWLGRVSLEGNRLVYRRFGSAGDRKAIDGIVSVLLESANYLAGR